jgi:hypothetical protein
MKWDIEHIRLCELAHAWKKRAEAAERKVDELLIQQDGLAREIERLREQLFAGR